MPLRVVIEKLNKAESSTESITETGITGLNLRVFVLTAESRPLKKAFTALIVNRESNLLLPSGSNECVTRGSVIAAANVPACPR